MNYSYHPSASVLAIKLIIGIGIFDPGSAKTFVNKIVFIHFNVRILFIVEIRCLSFCVWFGDVRESLLIGTTHIRRGGYLTGKLTDLRGSFWKRIMGGAIDGCWIMLSSLRCISVDVVGRVNGEVGLYERDELLDLVRMETLFKLFDECMQLNHALRSVVDNLKPFGSIQTESASSCFRIVDRVAACFELVEEGSYVFRLLMRAWLGRLTQR